MSQSVSQFSIAFLPAQQAILDQWLDICRWTWNEGLGLLLEQEARSVYSKPDKAMLPRSLFSVCGEGTPRPVRSAMFCNEIDGEKIWAAHCWILPKDRKGGTVDRTSGQTTYSISPDTIRVGQCCPLPIAEWSEPRLGFQPVGDYTLQYWFAQKSVREKYSQVIADRFCTVPTWFIRGVCKSLITSWQQYKKGANGSPRFKRPNDLTESLTHEDGKSFSIVWKELSDADRAAWKLPAHQEKAALIKIPKLGAVYAAGLEDWGNRPIKVLRLVRNPDRSWKLQLTAWEVQFGDVDSAEFEKVRESLSDRELAVIADWLKYRAIADSLATLPGWSTPAIFYWWLELPLWNLKRRVNTTLNIVGKDYLLATDDRGVEYTALPMRKDGAIDPHQRIATLEAKILAVQQAIDHKKNCHKSLESAGLDKGEGKRLQALYKKLAVLKREEKLILSNSRKKVAHFVSERSRSITVIEPAVTKQRKPKAKLKPGTFDPPVFEPNQAQAVAEHNRSVSGTAPGEFVALIKAEAKERNQKVIIKKPEKPAKKAKKR